MESFASVVLSDDLELVRQHILSGANVNEPVSFEGRRMTPLQIAARTGLSDVCSLLIASQSDVENKGEIHATALHLASFAGSLATVEVLLTAGASVDAVTHWERYTPLHLAAGCGHTEVTRLLLANGSDVDAMAHVLSPEGDEFRKGDSYFSDVFVDTHTPLNLAAIRGHADVVTILLEHGANINFPMPFGHTLLHDAAGMGLLSTVKILLAAGADPNVLTRTSHETPLHCAASGGHHFVVEQLLASGAKNNLRTSGKTSLGSRPLSRHDTSLYSVLNGELTPLHLAALCGDADTIRTLVQTGAELESQTNPDFSWREVANFGPRVIEVECTYFDVGPSTQGATIMVGELTPLQLSTLACQNSASAVLRKEGAQIDFRDANGMTPLHRAAHLGILSAVKKLVVAGSDIQARTPADELPITLAQESEVREYLLSLQPYSPSENYYRLYLHKAVSEGDSTKVQWLIAAGADVNERAPESGQSPLHVAADAGDAIVSTLLVEAGANVAAMDYCENTPLHLAVKHGHLDAVRVLLSHGAPCDAKGMNWITPLHIAAEFCNIKAIDMLLDAGSNIDVKNLWNMTPLHHAAASGSDASVIHLLMRGASANTCDISSQTPVDWATKNGHLGIVRHFLTTRS